MAVADLPEKVRTFIAVEVDSATRRKLVSLQKELARGIPEEAVRWTPLSHMHLTLKFLGNVTSSDLGDVEVALREACEGIGPFELCAERLGGFPSLPNPRVLWVGLSGDREVLKSLQDAINRATDRWSQKEEKRSFRPHLTLGRVREKFLREARRVGQRLQEAECPQFKPWKVEEIELMRSQLSPRGSTYTVLASVDLR